MHKYKLIHKQNPQNRKARMKWFAIPAPGSPLSLKEMSRMATENTMMSPAEMLLAFDLFGRHAVMQLRQGHTVRVGELGTLRLVFKSRGVEDAARFDPRTMIKEPRVVFVPSKAFRDSVLQGISFMGGGLLEDGVGYSSVDDYLRAKGRHAPEGLEDADAGRA